MSVPLPTHEDAEIAVKRSVLDSLLLGCARAAGVEVHENAMVTRMERTRWGDWKVDVVHDTLTAPVVVAADGRNSTVARFRNLLPRVQRERLALQTHIPLPQGFGNRVVLQFLRQGYSGQAPVNADELNLCLVGKGPDINGLKAWAAAEFAISSNHSWRTVTPLTRSPLAPAHENVFLIGDAARVVEPFTGEGIYYALRSGELAAMAIAAIMRGGERDEILHQFSTNHARMYRGRLWINELARAAVVRPQIGSAFVRVAKMFPLALRLLTRKIAG